MTYHQIYWISETYWECNGLQIFNYPYYTFHGYRKSHNHLSKENKQGA
jgi:hypothetical protein